MNGVGTSVTLSPREKLLMNRLTRVRALFGFLRTHRRPQGLRARYVGVRRNLFDLRRSAAIQNLESIHRTRS
jgi:hypothetical protein